MNPQDDPEARIRALEPTELGAEQPSVEAAPPSLPPPTQQWPQPPAYGQPPYGGDPYAGGYAEPYPAPAPPPSGSGIKPWLVIIPIMVIVVLLAGGVAVYWMFKDTGTVTGTPGISGGGGDLSTAPAIPALPELPELPDLPPIVVDPGTPGGDVPAPGTTVTVTGIGVDRTIACTDNIVIINGADNTIETTGHCTAITVSGMENVVTAESVDEFAISGMNNRVTYRSGSPTISQSGMGNTIEQG